MSKIYLLVLILISSLSMTNAQKYEAFGYANGNGNTRYQMPGTKITSESENGLS